MKCCLEKKKIKVIAKEKRREWGSPEGKVEHSQVWGKLKGQLHSFAPWRPPPPPSGGPSDTKPQWVLFGVSAHSLHLPGPDHLTVPRDVSSSSPRVPGEHLPCNLQGRLGGGKTQLSSGGPGLPCAVLREKRAGSAL